MSRSWLDYRKRVSRGVVHMVCWTSHAIVFLIGRLLFMMKK